VTKRCDASVTFGDLEELSHATLEVNSNSHEDPQNKEHLATPCFLSELSNIHVPLLEIISAVNHSRACVS
jgi:hypothetical protein